MNEYDDNVIEALIDEGYAQDKERAEEYWDNNYIGEFATLRDYTKYYVYEFLGMPESLGLTEIAQRY